MARHTPQSKKAASPAKPGAPAFRAIPLGRIKPAGWLRDQLHLQADGLTGHLEALWPDVGADSAWLGGAGEDWERGPYYLDGLVPLAWTLHDKVLKKKARKWMDALLNSQRGDGFFGPATNTDWWPRMVALKALIQYAEASADARVIPFLTRYFRFQLHTLPEQPLNDWAQARGAENILSVLWLHERSGEAWLLDLAKLLLKQTLDWETYLLKKLIKTPATTFSHFTHVVNVAMALKTFAVQFILDGDRRHLTAARKALANLDRYHGNAVGMFNGDEWLAGDSPSSGFELCAVVEFMFSLEQLARVFGQREFSDRLEQIAFNALPAHFDARMTAHQYHQQVNQVLCNVARRDWTMAFDDANTFGLSPHFGCCTANFHQGWPKFAGSLWMRSPDGGLAATAYAPNRIKVDLAGVAVTIKTQTDYPFKDVVRLKVRAGRAVRFPLWLRIPVWCDAPEISCNGKAMDGTPDAAGYVCIERKWRMNDEIILRLPMKLRAISRPNNAISLAAGALTLAFWPGEIWERIPGSAGFGDWEVRARNSWSFAPAIDPSKLVPYPIEMDDVPSPPFALKNPLENGRVSGAPLRVRVPLHLLTPWGMSANSAAQPPASPIDSSGPVHHLHLVPYGCTRIRIAEMPWARQPEKDAPTN